jgi:hypothetical protein
VVFHSYSKSASNNNVFEAQREEQFNINQKPLTNPLAQTE